MRDVIRGRAHPVRGRLALGLLRGDERGAVAIIVCLLMGTVLLGLGALVIDVGQLYQERSQLQNGADAAAIAVAKGCIFGTCTQATAQTTAQNYANENGSGGVAGLGVVCGAQAGSTLTACGASTGAMTDCPAAPVLGQTGYVDVHTSTKTSGGSTLIAPVLAKQLLGNGSYTGTKVLACAQAAWGGVPPSGLITAFTISACEWYAATTNGTVYAQPPPYPPNTAPSSTLDRVLHLRSTSGTGCTAFASPDDAASLYGWMAETGGCSLNNIVGLTYAVLNSTSSPNCNTPLFDDAQNKSVISVPVFTSVNSFGSTSSQPSCSFCAVYNLYGIASFVVTGYNIPGTGFNTYTDWLKPANQCTGTTYCINGYFVRTVAPFSGTFGLHDLGANMVKLSG